MRASSSRAPCPFAVSGPLAAAVLVSAGSLTCASHPARAQQGERYRLVATRDADTLSVERATRSAQELRSEVLVPARARLTVVAALDPDGCVTGASVDVFPWGSAEGSTPVQRVVVRREGDSLRVEARARDVSQNAARPAPGVRFVMAGDSWAASAMVVECGLAAADSSTLHVAAFPGLRLEDITVMRRGTEVTVAGKDTSRVTLGDDGRPVRLQVGRTGVVVHRAPWVEAAPAEPSTDYGPPPGAPYRAEEVSVRVRDDVVLAGTLTLPDGGGPAAAVVLVSGGGAQDRDSYAPVGGGWRLPQGASRHRRRARRGPRAFGGRPRRHVGGGGGHGGGRPGPDGRRRRSTPRRARTGALAA